ncbi:hypothetical protein B7494_g2014 [Chlorociboria aeruginascens]|nr:hypothetical protein B7494_g2014 [Chlorociboria aeruginascens]
MSGIPQKTSDGTGHQPDLSNLWSKKAMKTEFIKVGAGLGAGWQIPSLTSEEWVAEIAAMEREQQQDIQHHERAAKELVSLRSRSQLEEYRARMTPTETGGKTTAMRSAETENIDEEVQKLQRKVGELHERIQKRRDTYIPLARQRLIMVVLPDEAAAQAAAAGVAAPKSTRYAPRPMIPNASATPKPVRTTYVDRGSHAYTSHDGKPPFPSHLVPTAKDGKQ